MIGVGVFLVFILVFAAAAALSVRPSRQSPVGTGWVYCGTCGQRLGHVGVNAPDERVFAAGRDHQCPGPQS